MILPSINEVAIDVDSKEAINALDLFMMDELGVSLSEVENYYYEDNQFYISTLERDITIEMCLACSRGRYEFRFRKIR